MHTVFEDGPRRDRRLWIGDLRLQALASYSTFKNFDLAKRCLYLFAAMPYNEAGLLPACLYEFKEPHAGGNAIVDYSLLFGVSLLDYVKASGDKEAGKELWLSALKQFELLMDRVGEDFVYAIHPSQGEGGGMWTFIDCASFLALLPFEWNLADTLVFFASYRAGVAGQVDFHPLGLPLRFTSHVGTRQTPRHAHRFPSASQRSQSAHPRRLRPPDDPRCSKALL